MAACSRILLLWLTFSALVYISSAEEEASDVTVLNPDNFDDFVGKGKDAFVEFYAPWCGHCKKLAPEYDQVGTAFKKQNAVIAKVDCDEHKELCSRFGVSGYPTLKFFPKGSLEPEAYNGGRTAQDIIDFVNEKAGTSASIGAAPSDVVVLTPSNFDKVVLDKEKFKLVEFYAPWCGHCKSLAPVYEKLATAFKAEKNVVIAKCDADSHRSLGERYGVEGFPTIKYFVPGSEVAENFEGDRSLSGLVDFVNEQAGTFRSTSGSLNGQAGKISVLDELAEEFLKASGEARDAVVAKIAEAVAASTVKSAAQYAKVVKSINEKGDDYPQKETARLQRMMAGKVSQGKLDEFTIRVNVLSSFLPRSPTNTKEFGKEED